MENEIVNAAWERKLAYLKEKYGPDPDPFLLMIMRNLIIYIYRTEIAPGKEIFEIKG